MTTTDPNTTATPETESQHPLVGRFFHTTRICSHGCRVAQWQGHILAVLSPGMNS